MPNWVISKMPYSGLIWILMDCIDPMRNESVRSHSGRLQYGYNSLVGCVSKNINQRRQNKHVYEHHGTMFHPMSQIFAKFQIINSYYEIKI